jgi:hypothetical protein
MRNNAVLFSVIVCAASFAFLSPDAGAQPSAVETANNPVELRGSPTSLARENQVADQWHLQRYKDAAELRAAEGAGQLVPVRSHGSVTVADDIGDLDKANAEAYRYARPWVAWFLDDLVADPSFPKGADFKVTSLVRSEVYQRRVLKVSLTAAKGNTPMRRSSHLTGSTVDITTKDMPDPLKAWMRKALLNLERKGLVQATEEQFGSLCFHVMVFPNYQKGTVPCAVACH